MDDLYVCNHVRDMHFGPNDACAGYTEHKRPRRCRCEAFVAAEQVADVVRLVE